MLARHIINKNINPILRGFSTNIFNTETINLNNKNEVIVKGGKYLHPVLKYGFKDINQIGIIGWGSQAPSQALNLRDSLKDTDINISIGLRENSNSISKANSHNFTKESNTLDEMYKVVSESDMILYLVSDVAQVETHQKLFENIKPGSTLGLSHGFLLGYFDLHKELPSFPDNINVVMVAPKGMGPTLRDKYLLGSGINSSVAIHQDVNGLATDHALSWAIGIGSPYIFKTTMREEYISDIFGERGVLLGGIYGISESLFRILYNTGLTKKRAYQESAYNITGTINNYISNNGILNVYQDMDISNRSIFESYYHKFYPLAKELLQEIYDEVKSGNEINSVIMAGKRLDKYPLGNIDTTDVWLLEKQYRDNLKNENINPITASIYISTMMAQIDILIENNHSYSEIINESIIEAVDSLNPYLYQKGISYMIDNCSTTARLGSRKWGPRFDYLYTQNINNVNLFKPNVPKESKYIEDFINHPIHDMYTKLNKYK